MLYTPSPIVHMINNNLSRTLRAMLSAYSFDKIAIWVCLPVSNTTIPSLRNRLTH